MVGRVKDKNIEAKYVYDEYKAKSADANCNYTYVNMLHGFWANSRAPGTSNPLLNIFWEDEGVWNLMSLERLSMLALHVWYRWQASILGAL